MRLPREAGMRSQLTMVVLLAAMGRGSMYAAEKTSVVVYVSGRDASASCWGLAKF